MSNVETSTPPVAPEARAAITHILEHQQAAWNAGDAPAWSALFLADADFVNIRGDAFHGKDAIIQQHARISGGPFRGSHTTITLRLLTSLAPGALAVDADYEVTGFTFLPPGIIPTAPGVLKTRMKYTAVRHGDAWHFANAQNTAILPAPPPPPAGAPPHSSTPPK